LNINVHNVTPTYPYKRQKYTLDYKRQKYTLDSRVSIINKDLLNFNYIKTENNNLNF